MSVRQFYTGCLNRGLRPYGGPMTQPRNDYLIASFMVAYILTGLFHYTARHFVFWVEFSVFYFYVFYQEKGDLVNEKKSI